MNSKYLECRLSLKIEEEYKNQIISLVFLDQKTLSKSEINRRYINL